MNTGMTINTSRAVWIKTLDNLHHSVMIFHNVEVRQRMGAHRMSAKSIGGAGFSQVQKLKPTKSDMVLGCPLASAPECNKCV